MEASQHHIQDVLQKIYNKNSAIGTKIDTQINETEQKFQKLIHASKTNQTLPNELKLNPWKEDILYNQLELIYAEI